MNRKCFMNTHNKSFTNTGIKSLVKKNFLLSLILITILAFSGCGNNSQNGSSDADSDGSAESQSSTSFTEFTATDIYGEEVTEEIFADYSLTLVNVWGTFCGPCIEEMPYLGELQKEYQSKDVNIIGIVVDVQDSDLTVIDEQVELAKEIAVETGAEYRHLIISSDFSDVIGGITAIPASFFVDSEGNIVSEVYVGSKTKKEWTETIEDHLEK